jgi:hypothetical protein
MTYEYDDAAKDWCADSLLHEVYIGRGRRYG